MIKDNLKIAIKEFHESSLPDLVERQELFDFSILHSPINKVITIIGPRRAGKTYFLYQIIKKLIEEKNHITDILYINFEDERLFGFGLKDLSGLTYKEIKEFPVFNGVKLNSMRKLYRDTITRQATKTK